MELPPRNCPSCGAVNLATAIYCISCRAILPAIPVHHGVMGRVGKPRNRRPWLGPLVRIARYGVGLAFLICLGLAAWPASREDRVPRTALSGELDLSQLFLRPGAAGTRTALGHQIGHALMRSAADPLLSFATVRLGEGTAVLRLGYSWKGIPWTFTSQYRLEGDSGQWRLTPVSGSLGHLPVGGRVTGMLLSFLLSRNPAVPQVLSVLSDSPYLEISGNVLRF